MPEHAPDGLDEDAARWQAGLRPYDVELHEDGGLRYCIPRRFVWAREAEAWDHLVPTRRWTGSYSQTPIAIYLHYIWARSQSEAIALTQARFRREIGRWPGE